MPRITISADNSAPSYITPPDGATALFLMIKNTGDVRIYMAMRPNVTNGAPAGNSDEEEDADLLARQGMPLEPGEYRDFAETCLDLNRRFYFVAEPEGAPALNYEYGV